MGDLRELIARLEKLEGPSREVDCTIALTLDGFEIDERGGYAYRDPDGNLNMSGNAKDMLVPRYTASLDGAIALCERVLPGWSINLEFTNGIADDVYLIGPGYRSDQPHLQSSPPVAGKPICVALLLATLHAKAQESGK